MECNYCHKVVKHGSEDNYDYHGKCIFELAERGRAGRCYACTKKTPDGKKGFCTAHNSDTPYSEYRYFGKT